MNVNINMNISARATTKKLDTLNGSNKTEQFKKILNNHEVSLTNSKDEVELKTETVKSLELSIQAQNKDTEKLSEELTGEDVINDDVDQIQQMIQYLSSMFQDIQQPTPNNREREIDFINPQVMDEEHINIIDKSKVELMLLEKNKTNSNVNNQLEVEIVSFIETYIDVLKQNSKEAPSKESDNDQIEQIQQVLQSLSSMFQNHNEVSVFGNQENDGKDISLDQLINVEKLTPETKDMLKNNLSKILVLMEKADMNNKVPSQLLQLLQGLTSEILEAKGDLSSAKANGFQNVMVNSETISIKDSLLKKVIEQNIKIASEISPENQMRKISDIKKDNNFSGNSSFEEKFLSKLIDSDKDEGKISKAVSFMNQFQDTKTVSTAKVETPNLMVDKNNFTVDVIKTMKFMENNNIRNLTVTMSPKELGEITIKLTMESGIMKANISAQNKETFNLLDNNMQDISDKLKSMDIKIQSIDINIYEDSTFFSKEQSNKNGKGAQNNESRTNTVLEEEEEEMIIRSNYGIEQNGVNKFV